MKSPRLERLSESRAAMDQIAWTALSATFQLGPNIRPFIKFGALTLVIRNGLAYASFNRIGEEHFFHFRSKLSYRERLLQNALLSGIEFGRTDVSSHI